MRLLVETSTEKHPSNSREAKIFRTTSQEEAFVYETLISGPSQTRCAQKHGRSETYFDTELWAEVKAT